MAPLAARGLTLDLPPGWHGRISRRETVPADARPAAAGPGPAEPPAMAHAATFALPRGMGDFGGGAVELMAPHDLFLALIEFDADSAGTALFARTGLPRRLRADQFDPQGLQRTIAGQGGAQAFFTTAGRPFCLYVVLGSYNARASLVDEVNEVLGGVRIA